MDDIFVLYIPPGWDRYGVDGWALVSGGFMLPVDGMEGLMGVDIRAFCLWLLFFLRERYLVMGR